MNEAHEKSIEAAIKAATSVAWRAPDDTTVEKARFLMAESMIAAYLKASGLVLVPRRPTEEMMEYAAQRIDRGGARLNWIGMLARSHNPFESKDHE